MSGGSVMIWNVVVYYQKDRLYKSLSDVTRDSLSSDHNMHSQNVIINYVWIPLLQPVTEAQLRNWFERIWKKKSWTSFQILLFVFHPNIYYISLYTCTPTIKKLYCLVRDLFSCHCHSNLVYGFYLKGCSVTSIVLSKLWMFCRPKRGKTVQRCRRRKW
jgi:hypothetical protein